MRATFTCLAALIGMMGAEAAEAASLRVSPVTLDLRMPRGSATMTLRNDADRPIDVQVRVFRWTQKGGVDQYETTSAVVASPPATRLAPHVDYTIRVVRTSKAPIATEESYRVIIDEIPTNLVRRSGTVNFVMRHSIPVFFRNPQARGAKVSWKFAQVGGKLKLIAENTGGTRLRISDLSLLHGDGQAYAKKGLAGYVLAGAAKEWPVDLGRRRPASPLKLKAHSQLGAVDEIVPFINR